MNVGVALGIVVVFFFLPGLTICCIINKEVVKKVKEKIISFFEIVLTFVLLILPIVFILCMSFVPYEPTTLEDIYYMEVHEQIRCEQMILAH